METFDPRPRRHDRFYWWRVVIMLVSPTDRWINSIAIPNNGVVQKPRNKKQVNVSDYVGWWLIDGGFAIGEQVSTVDQLKQPESAPIPEVVTPLATIPKKAASKPFVLEKNS